MRIDPIQCYLHKAKEQQKETFLMKTSGRHFSYAIISLLLLVFSLGACGSTNDSTGGNTNSSGPVTIHLGYFPNLTHAVAVVGVARGTFKQALGSNVTLDTKTFNAGPAEIEA